MDVIIIGAGPSGLFASFICNLLGMKCCIIDSLSSAGGQCTALYSDKPIYDIPAYSQILAKDLIKNLLLQIEPFNVQFTFDTIVQFLQVIDDKVHVKTNTKSFTASACILASGAGTVSNIKLPLPNLEKLQHKIHYKLENLQKFKDKTILVIGGGDSALDWTLCLMNIAKTVYLVHRRVKFRASQFSLKNLQPYLVSEKCKMFTPYQLISANLNDKSDDLVHCLLQNTQNDSQIKIDVNYIIPCLGVQQAINTWNLQSVGNKVCVNACTMESSQKRIYAIGDTNIYENKQKLIVCGFSEATLAAYHIRQNLITKHHKFEYSTSAYGKILSNVNE